MRIGNKQIGLEYPPYIIAEIGVNHDGAVDRALSLTDAAADAGADAVKLQFFETDRLMSSAAKLAAYQKNAGETDPIEMLRRLELTIDEMALVVDRAHERGIHAIVTVFSTELVEIAETLAWDAYKTASPDIVNRPLLEALAKMGKPMIVSTGASTLDEVVRAMDWLEGVRDRLAVLQCVSSYPTPDLALGGIKAIRDATDLPVGYSDHSKDPKSSELATALGGCVLEKHITYNRNAPGPDHAASITSRKRNTMHASGISRIRLTLMRSQSWAMERH
jgi:N,N'-diacetyllegionaminate synthase